MSQFPLYLTLISNLPEKDLTVIQKNDLIKKISTLDPDAHELIYALVKCFFIEHSKGNSLSLPYGGILIKDKIEFNLLDFPNKLRQLLFKFVNIHKKKMDEDEKLGK